MIPTAMKLAMSANQGLSTTRNKDSSRNSSFISDSIPRFPSKLGPTLKRHIYPWWLCTLSLIWWEMTCKTWFMTYQWLELIWNTFMCENYTPLTRFSSVWMNLVFPLMFFRNKMQNYLNLICGSVNSIFVLSFLIVAFWKILFWSVWRLIHYKACS